MSLKGSTAEFSLDTVLRLLADGRKTGELTLRGTGGEGALGLADGRVVTAVFGEEKPIPALGAVFAIGDAEFEFTSWQDAPAANLEGELQDNLRRAEEYKQWLASVREVIPNDRVRFRLSERAAEQGAVTFTSDRWRVVLAVNGQRDVDAMAEHLKLDRDATLTTLSGLVRDGVIETMDAPAEPPPTEPPQAPPAAQAEPVPPVVEETTKDDWTAALLENRQQEPETPPADPWSAPAAPEPVARWDEPASAWSPPAEPVTPVDDRLAALFGDASPAPAPHESTPAADAWTAPASEWTTPAPAAPEWTAPDAPAADAPADDPRLSALSAAPSPVEEAPAPVVPPPSEWAPPPVPEAPTPEKKRGLFGMFKREEPAPEPAPRTTFEHHSASTVAGQLAAFSNALLTEYNSGHYGKGRVDEHIPRLLMRVDEQADPIDRPLPVVDDRLDVQALERVGLPESQAVPYLALLVTTIYGDAEKAFGRDKAKRGYRAAQQHVFGADTAVLGTADLAGKLPKI